MTERPSENGTPSILNDGLRAAWPICVGYVPIGLAFGVLAQKAGLSALAVGLMSALVFAGSSQFIAVAMLGAGAGIASIVATTFAVNLRHLLMSSALSVHLKGVRRRWLTLFAYGITDESFALNLVRFREGGWDWRRALTVNHVTNAAWVTSTVAGALGGALIPAHAFGIDYALMGMFLCLLVYQLRGRIYVLTALIAGAAAVAISLMIPGNSYIVAASVIAATAGLIIRRRWPSLTHSSPPAGEEQG
jgi:4-azaleucine resistance transporter AzlC